MRPEVRRWRKRQGSRKRLSQGTTGKRKRRTVNRLAEVESPFLGLCLRGGGGWLRLSVFAAPFPWGRRCLRRGRFPCGWPAPPLRGWASLWQACHAPPPIPLRSGLANSAVPRPWRCRRGGCCSILVVPQHLLALSPPLWGGFPTLALPTVRVDNRYASCGPTTYVVDQSRLGFVAGSLLQLARGAVGVENDYSVNSKLFIKHVAHLLDLLYYTYRPIVKDKLFDKSKNFRQTAT